MDCKRPNSAPLTAYTTGCRCERCRTANTEYHRAYRAANPEVIRAIRMRDAARKRRLKEKLTKSDNPS